VNRRRISFPPNGDALRRVRVRLRELAAEMGMAAAGNGLALVVDELVNNAIEHGRVYRLRGLDLVIQLSPADGGVLVEFFDQEMPGHEVDELAKLLAAAAGGTPALENERGRGLFLLTVYLTELRAEAAPGGGLRLAGRLSPP
jgi:anti-sigma regulatory factor (Ser/Thr protein kinase)